MSCSHFALYIYILMEPEAESDASTLHFMHLSTNHLLVRFVANVRLGVAHHLVPLLLVAGVVGCHVLLAGVGTVGVAVPLGLGGRHRPLQVGRLVLRQCRLPSEISWPASVSELLRHCQHQQEKRKLSRFILKQI